MEHRGVISNIETGNPPEGWESEGQLRIAKLKLSSFQLLAPDSWIL
jgi:hypothetical protein